jgi:antibiotic biosynthesis monooxygenase (ABM) superfamily enzyme
MCLYRTVLSLLVLSLLVLSLLVLSLSKGRRVEGSLCFETRPSTKKSDVVNEYTVAFKFENLETLTALMDSEERKTEVKIRAQFSENEMELEPQQGINFWFQAAKEKPAGAPPKSKMSLLTWLAVFPGVVIVSQLYHTLFSTFPALIFTLFVTLTSVPLLTWVLMPNMVKWLF